MCAYQSVFDVSYHDDDGRVYKQSQITHNIVDYMTDTAGQASPALGGWETTSGLGGW